MNNKTKNIIIDILVCIILSLIIILTSINNWYIIPVICIGIIILLLIIFKRKKTDITTGSPFIEEPVKDTKPKEMSDLELEAKTLYLDMQKYFMKFEYDKLHDILSDTLYKQFEKEMKTLQSNNRRAVRDNIEIIDFTILDDNKVSMGVLEDKYTRAINSTYKRKNVRYESYYEITIINHKIDDLRLIYSHSKKD